MLAPNDIQSPHEEPSGNSSTASPQSREDVVIDFEGHADTSSLCVDTSAFVGVTVAFIMILVVAIITIVFLWMRIKSLNAKSKASF